jgi:hypothetical protein
VSAIDLLPGASAPFYGPPGSHLGPVPESGQAEIQDAPQVVFQLTQPVATEPVNKDPAGCAHLETITLESKFHIWLVVWPSFLPLAESNLLFLTYIPVSLSQIADVTTGNVKNGPSQHGMGPPQFTGKGAATPQLGGTTASQFIKFGPLPIPGLSCPVGLPR